MKVIMYTSGFCPFCVNAEKFLNSKGINSINKIFIDESEEDLQKMIKITGKRTVPQIFIDNQYIGGFDELILFDESGALDEILNNSSS